MDRVSVAEAARRLNISQDAVYKRIKRGTIPWEKGEDDKTYVWIDEVDRSTDRARPSTDRPFESSNYVSKDELLSEMRARVSFLEEELQRKDAILLSLTQRIPELEPPKDSSSEPRQSPEKATEEFYGTHAPPMPEQPVERPESEEHTLYGTSAQEAEESLQRRPERSWWRRFFGLE
jgi:hypothetical protein